MPWRSRCAPRTRRRRCRAPTPATACSRRSEEHTSELQSQSNLVCRLLLEKKTHMSVGGITGIAVVLHLVRVLQRLRAVFSERGPVGCLLKSAVSAPGGMFVLLPLDAEGVV